ncbi:Pectate lyase [Dillenia turbinata]|uniref:Pectate lyase n=1 Tax=Dillenia turbinata TaxID=194707 RepID=A0AAN8WAR4_9MAGN
MAKPGASLFVFIFAFATLVPILRADIGVFDEFWQKRAEKARKEALEAYEADPQSATEYFNYRVNNATIDMAPSNSTRRHMRENKGKCIATNPIDRCWRCDKKWYYRRKKLASCVLGFGRRTTGGKRGRYYVVTDPSDNDMVNPKPGTLRHAVIQKEPLWIIFARSMIITLRQELLVNSHKTIDGRGVNVHIAYGAGIMIQFVQNVIVHGLHFHHIVAGNGGLIRDSIDHYGWRTPSDGDAISIFGSTNIWIDHNSLSKCKDGLIDAVAGSTAITISNNHMTHHNDVMLLGANDNTEVDRIMQVTIAFNHFGRGLVQRMPRCRWGFFHVVNNDYTHWLMFWQWRSRNDLFENGAYFIESGLPLMRKPFSRQDMIKAKPGSFAPRLTRFAGALRCRKHQPC